MIELAVRLTRRFERVIRFLLVGSLIVTFFTLATLALIWWVFPADATLAAAVASVLTTPVSFFVHRRITYVDVEAHSSQWPRFVVLTVANFILSTGSMKLVDSAGAEYWIGIATVWVLSPVMNYLINAMWVFQARTLLRLDREGTRNLDA
jgi:putative flippase GtrA